jgi:hypothetical protein
MAGGEPVKGLALARFGLWVEKKSCVGAKRCDTSLSKREIGQGGNNNGGGGAA